MIQAGLGGKIGRTAFKRMQVNSAEAQITLTPKYPNVQFVLSQTIDEAKEILISENSSSFQLWLLMDITSLVAITWPENVRMADPLWNDETLTWTPIDTGLYEVKGVYDGTNWHISITGLFTGGVPAGIFDNSFDDSFE